MIYPKESLWDEWDEYDENEWFNARERERLKAAYRAEWGWDEECDEQNEGDGLTREQREVLNQDTWGENADYIIDDFISRKSGEPILEHQIIAEGWAMDSARVGPPHTTVEKYFELRNWYEEKIIQAVFDEKLKAEVVTRKNYKGVMKFVPRTRTAFDRLRFDREVVDGNGGGIYLEIFVNRKNFCKWLSKELGQWPLSESCLLSKWFENEHLDVQVDDIGLKTKGRRYQKRMKILNGWYGAVCNKLENNPKLINEKIDRLTIEEIRNELESLTPTNEQYIWKSGAHRWLQDHGGEVWGAGGFKRTQGAKCKKV